ncbi:hypothetical protein FKM82_024671 [Ascaphus truei]
MSTQHWQVFCLTRVSSARDAAVLVAWAEEGSVPWGFGRKGWDSGGPRTLAVPGGGCWGERGGWIGPGAGGTCCGAVTTTTWEICTWLWCWAGPFGLWFMFSFWVIGTGFWSGGVGPISWFQSWFCFCSWFWSLDGSIVLWFWSFL